MDLYSLICLCVVNGFFTLAGIFLNSVVIISLWKSSQLRRKTCYFMILVLSCFDLGVVMVGHPTIMLVAIISWSSGYKTALQMSEQYHNCIYSFTRICRVCIAHNEHWQISCYCSSYLSQDVSDQIPTSQAYAAPAVTDSRCPNLVFHPKPVETL